MRSAFRTFVAVIFVFAAQLGSHRCNASHEETGHSRFLQSDTDEEEDPSILLYENMPAVGAKSCAERSQCMTTHSGWIRFGAKVGRKESYVYKKMNEGVLFYCIISEFGSDPYVGQSKVCQQEVIAPTPAPSFGPTQYPTIKPTASPSQAGETLSPTLAPLETPSQSPTVSPTGQPSTAPTATLPTLAPTGLPSTLPSASPETQIPTGAPLSSPTSSPSAAPSGAPGTTPTVIDETVAPVTTAAPTLEGTQQATRTPTPEPSNSTPLTSSPTSSPVTKADAQCLGLSSNTDCSANQNCLWSGTKCETLRVGSRSSESGLSWAPIVATNLAIFGIVICVAALAFVHIHRYKPVIQLSQAFFLKMVCVGALLVNTAVFPSAFEPKSVGLCYLRKWWFDLAFTFALSMMLVKVWRVWKVFNSPVGKSMHITNSYLIKCVAGVMAIDIILLLAWTLSPDGVEIATSETNSGNICLSTGTGLWLLFLSYVFLALLVLVTAFFACRVKDLGSVLGESRQIFTIANNILVFGMFSILLTVSDAVTEDIRVLFFAFSIFWCSTVGVIVLVQAKYERFYMTREEILRAATEKKSMSQGASMSGREGFDTQGSFNTGAQTTTGNTGFLDDVELHNLTGNAPRPRGFPTGKLYASEGGGGSYTTHATAVDEIENRLQRSASTRSYTDAAPALHLARDHLSPRGRGPTPNFGDKFLSGVKKNAGTPLSSASSNSVHQNNAQAQNNHSMKLTSKADDQQNSTSSSEPEKAPEKTRSVTMDKPDSSVKAEERPAPTMVQQAVPGELSLSSGFKVGERGVWEEFIHRETGETFWSHKETGQITQSLEDISTGLNVV